MVFADIFIMLMAIAIICIIIAISCRVIEIFWICIYACLSPLMCPNRHREPWPIEICNCLIILVGCIEKICISNCCVWCGHINRKLRRCNIRLKLCKIRVNKNFNKIRVKPIIYDDVHIIVINPYDSCNQIATVSKVIHT